MSENLIDADIRIAQTLPSSYYNDPSTFRRVLSSFTGWQFAAHTSELESHNVIPLDHIELLTKESLIISRSETTQCMSNVCTHRGMRLVDKKCNEKMIRCSYHGRSFDLEGKFCHMPEFEDAIDFPSDADNLQNTPIKEWLGMYFTAQKVSVDFPWEMLENRLGFLNPETFTHDPSRDRDFSIEANWMLYVDNYLEGFHIPYVHPELNQALDYSNYTTEIFPGGVLQIGKAEGNDVKFEYPSGHQDENENIAAYYLWLFPNMMFNFYPWGLSVNIVIPVSPTQCRVLYRGYVFDKDIADKGAGAKLDLVEEQDQSIIESVQRSIQSSAYDRGRYSPTMERGVHHFHQIITQF